MLPDSLRQILERIGQAACELPTTVEGQAEFVSVSKARISIVPNAANRFPWLRSGDIYHISRYRVRESDLADDVNICEQSLFDHQKIYVGTEQQAQFILELWLDDLSKLIEPSKSRVPL